MKPVVIVGAGLAGLTAAAFLRRHGVPVRVFEAGPAVAGLARGGPADDDGFGCDFGARFITNRLAAAVGVAGRCRPVARYGEAVWLRGRAYPSPGALLRTPRFFLSAAWARVCAAGGPPPASAADWFRRHYGSQLTDEVALPLAEAWAGVPAADLAPEAGERFAAGMPRAVLLKGAAAPRPRPAGRTIIPDAPDVWHVHPEGGIGAVCARLADEVADAVATGTPVDEVHVEDGRAVGVRAGGEDVPAAAVVSTAPVHRLADMIRGTDRLAYLRRFEYRAVAFVNLKLDGPGGLPDVVTWTPGLPFFRASDVGAGLPWAAPPGRSLVTCDVGCRPGDVTWRMSDDQLGRVCVRALDRLVPDASARYLGCRVLRAALAYPVYHRSYEADRRRFGQGTGIDGLVCVGRTGEFTHTLMEDVFWQTRRKMGLLVDEVLTGPALRAAG